MDEAAQGQADSKKGILVCLIEREMKEPRSYEQLRKEPMVVEISAADCWLSAFFEDAKSQFNIAWGQTLTCGYSKLELSRLEESMNGEAYRAGQYGVSVFVHGGRKIIHSARYLF
jgi:hypothetical protein